MLQLELWYMTVVLSYTLVGNRSYYISLQRIRKGMGKCCGRQARKDKLKHFKEACIERVTTEWEKHEFFLKISEITRKLRSMIGVLKRKRSDRRNTGERKMEGLYRNSIQRR